MSGYPGSSSGSGASDGGSAPNPVLATYESWANNTPFITRCTMIALVSTYIFSFIFDLEGYLGNTPYYTVMKVELYRLLVPFLVGNSLFGVIIIALFFPSMASRLEQGLGSLGLLSVIFTISVTTNLLFIAICLLFALMGSSNALMWNCQDFWTILFGLITIECLQMPDMPRRMMFIPINIPSKYFPLVLYGFICLFSGLILSYLVSMTVGYLYVSGHIDVLKIGDATLGAWENRYFASLTRRLGWVPMGSALGHVAWSALPTTSPSGNGGSGMYDSGMGQRDFGSGTSGNRGAPGAGTSGGGGSQALNVGRARVFGLNSSSSSSQGTESGSSSGGSVATMGGTTSSSSGAGSSGSGAGTSGYSMPSSGGRTLGGGSSSSSFASSSTSSNTTSTNASGAAATKVNREAIAAQRLQKYGNLTGSSGTSNSSSAPTSTSTSTTTATSTTGASTITPSAPPMAAATATSASNTTSSNSNATSTSTSGSVGGAVNSDIATLMELGYSRRAASDALSRSGGSLEVALDILMNEA